MTWPLGRRKDALSTQRLALVFGYARGARVVLVTGRGTEIPVPDGSEMTVVDVNGFLAWVDRLPELAPGSRRV